MSYECRKCSWYEQRRCTDDRDLQNSGKIDRYAEIHRMREQSVCMGCAGMYSRLQVINDTMLLLMRTAISLLLLRRRAV